MPQWFLDFLWACLPAAVKAWWNERKRLGEIADMGAAQQRVADKKAADVLAAEAKKHSDEVDALSDADLVARRSKWLHDE